MVDQGYIDLGPSRPILSVTWHVPGNEDLTIARLRNTADKISAFGLLPPWFGNLLPEGALRNLVETQMRSGAVTDFDIIKRLGSDLPGAVLVEGGIQEPRDAEEMDAAADTVTAVPKLKFSLAGVQLKFSAMRNDDRLTLPVVVPYEVLAVLGEVVIPASAGAI